MKIGRRPYLTWLFVTNFANNNNLRSSQRQNPLPLKEKYLEGYIGPGKLPFFLGSSPGSVYSNLRAFICLLWGGFTGQSAHSEDQGLSTAKA